MSEACSTHTRFTTWPLMSMPRMVGRVGARFVGVRRELDAAGLSASADVDLCLDDDRVADAVGGA